MELNIGELRPLIDLLAFYAAQKNYGYVDRLGNALDEITVYEALKDVVRDYNSLCLDRAERYVEVEVGGETVKLHCPNIGSEDLRRAADKFIEYIRGKSGDVIIKATRFVAVEALARKAKMLEELRVQG